MIEGYQSLNESNLSQEDGGGDSTGGHHEGTAQAVGGVGELRGSRAATS